MHYWFTSSIAFGQSIIKITLNALNHGTPFVNHVNNSHKLKLATNFIPNVKVNNPTCLQSIIRVINNVHKSKEIKKPILDHIITQRIETCHLARWFFFNVLQSSYCFVRMLSWIPRAPNMINESNKLWSTGENLEEWTSVGQFSTFMKNLQFPFWKKIRAGSNSGCSCSKKQNLASSSKKSDTVSVQFLD
jgi:hypothetical protein